MRQLILHGECSDLGRDKYFIHVQFKTHLVQNGIKNLKSFLTNELIIENLIRDHVIQFLAN